ncbi:MAG: histidine phosphatase family protein [Acidimicrobiaceae bacterium]|nr:histidine phosphatase family protein [Acidimicrobiaceae bacterium]
MATKVWAVCRESRQKMRKLLVRHAQSDWNVSGRWQGHADTPLSAHGRAQSVEAAKALTNSSGSTRSAQPLDMIFTSDLTRAKETSEIIAEILGVSTLIVDAGLRERAVGLWEGLTTAEINTQYPGDLSNRQYPPGWERDEDLLSRVLKSLRQIAKLAATRDRILIMSHTGVFYILDCYFNRKFVPIGNLCGREIHMEGNDMSLGKRIALIS